MQSGLLVVLVCLVYKCGCSANLLTSLISLCAQERNRRRHKSPAPKPKGRAGFHSIRVRLELLVPVKGNDCHEVDTCIICQFLGRKLLAVIGWVGESVGPASLSASLAGFEEIGNSWSKLEVD